MFCCCPSVNRGKSVATQIKHNSVSLQNGNIWILDFDCSFKPSISLMVTKLECCTVFFGAFHNFYPLLFCLLTRSHIFSIAILSFALIQRKCYQMGKKLSMLSIQNSEAIYTSIIWLKMHRKQSFSYQYVSYLCTSCCLRRLQERAQNVSGCRSPHFKRHLLPLAFTCKLMKRPF